MNDRKKATNFVERYNLTATSLAQYANCDRADVSRLLAGARVSPNLESKIGRTIRELNRLQEKFDVFPLDLNNVPLVRILLEKLDLMAFSLLVLNNPTTQYLHKYENGSVQLTPYLLGAAKFGVESAYKTQERLQAQFPDCLVLDNPYGIAIPETIIARVEQ